MLEFETQIIIARRQGLQKLIGEIMSDESRYQSEEFAWWHEQNNELIDRANKLGIVSLILNADNATYINATTARFVDVESPAATTDMQAA